MTAIKGAQDIFPLAQIQKRWCAPSEKNQRRPKIGCSQLDLSRQRRDVTVDEVAPGWMRIKSAILAFVGTERHVHVKAMDWLGGPNGHGSSIAQDGTWDNSIRVERAN